MEIQEYLRIIRSRWWIIVLFAVLGGAVGGGVTALIPGQYEAKTQLFVSTTRGESVTEAYQNNLFAQERVRTYAGLANSAQVSQRVADELNDGLSAAEISAKVSAQPVKDTALLDITVVDRDAEQARSIAKSVANQLVRLVRELETPAVGGLAAAGVTIVDEAQLPQIKSSPSLVSNVVAGVAAGLLIGLVVAVARGIVDTRIHDGQALALAAGGRLLGTVRGNGIAADVLDLDDEYRQIRTVVKAANTQVLTVVSPEAGEGRTSVAANLALALAEGGHAVLLIDGDIAAPELASVLGLAATPDLMTVLQGQSLLEHSTQTWSAGVSVLVLDPASQGRRSWMASDSTSELIDAARATFHHIVIDSPPLSSSVYATVWAGISDGALFVGRAGRADRLRVAEAAQTVKAAGADVIGTVLTLRVHRRRGDKTGPHVDRAIREKWKQASGRRSSAHSQPANRSD